MCYGFYPVKQLTGEVSWVDRKEFFAMERNKEIIHDGKGWVFAKAQCEREA